MGLFVVALKHRIKLIGIVEKHIHTMVFLVDIIVI
jgi:hypothetical protein